MVPPSERLPDLSLVTEGPLILTLAVQNYVGMMSGRQIFHKDNVTTLIKTFLLNCFGFLSEVIYLNKNVYFSI